MPSVDDRIVRMEFDNSSFEHKIASTLTSLGQLEKALKFDGAKTGFSDITSAADKVHFGGITSAIENVSHKFIALSTIAITVLSNITNKAVDAGLRMGKALTLEGVISGFEEYEQSIGSIQTILSNTRADGTNLEQVTAALDELNSYADKTIYNFGQMTKNIGTFTAAGVDLDTSVQSIKGISNLAAISGSTSEQASTAMYQLSQAVSTGTLKLMDWNSVVNAGMGGEVFQKALFETGKTLKTIPGVPIGQTFEEWTAGGNSFRSSLEKGWLTSEVLTTTLQGFTGEMTEAQLLAIGYTKEQAAEIIELGKVGVDAATKVRTLTGLIGTTKEAIGSGWAESFRIIVGNFEQATTLWSHFNKQISDAVGESADARNELLQGWADQGGRQLFIYGIQQAIDNLGLAIAPIKDAFREIFPPVTVETLMNLTQGFFDLTAAIKPNEGTVDRIHRIFKGFFAALEIGWTAIKETAKFIGELFDKAGAGEGKFLELAAKIGDFFTKANEKLVEGEGIKKFFEDLKGFIEDPMPTIDALKDKLVEFFDKMIEKLKEPIPFIDDLAAKIKDFFTGLKPEVPEAAGEAIERIGSRFETLKSIIDKIGDIWEPFKSGVSKVTEILDDIWEDVKDFFSELGQKIADALGESDWDAVSDALNVGLLAAIAGILGKFLKGGIKFDLGGGFFDKVSSSLKELTDTMEAMQTKLKSEALLNIAIAIGIIAAAVVALSLIDSGALTKALVAMSVGFGQLMGAFAILNKISVGPSSAVQFAAIATGMTILAGAILVLAAAAKLLGTMNWDELARGLTGVGVLLGIISLAVIPLSANSSGMIRVGIGLIGISVALGILAGVVAIFASMSWGEMARGMAGVAAGLLIIAGALKLMPNGASLALQGVGLIAIGVALTILAGALQLFASMSWGEMAKGMTGLAGGLLIIALAMKLMPPTMPLIGAGLLLVSVALVAIAAAMKMMGGMSWGEIAKGLVAMAGALLVLAVACKLMESSILGAIAIGIVSGALLLLAKVLDEFSGMSWGELLKGIGGIALALGALAISAMLLQPAIPALLGLGVALALVGVGFALFGVGAQAVAKAITMLSKITPAGAKAITGALTAIGEAIPALVKGFAKGLLELIVMIGEMAVPIAETLGKLLIAIIDKIIELTPKIAELIGALIDTIIAVLTENVPKLVQAGLDLILALLRGIRDNIGEVVTVVGEIITNFVDAFGTQLASIVQSVADLIIKFFESVAEALGRVAATILVGIGGQFIEGFLQGVQDSAKSGPMKWFMELAGNVIKWIGDVVSTLLQKGRDLISGLLSGITEKAKEVITWFGDVASKVLTWIGDLVSTLKNKGTDLIGGFLSGIIDKAVAVASWFGRVASNVLGWIGDLLRTLWDKGVDILSGFLNGITSVWSDVKSWFGGLPRRVLDSVTSLANTLYQIGRDVINGLWNGMKDVWGEVTGWLSNLNPVSWFNDIAPKPGHAEDNMVPSGLKVMEGFHNGMKEGFHDITVWLSKINPAESVGNNLSKSMEKTINSMLDQINTMDELNPVITPVLDLTRVQQDAKLLSSYISTPALSYNNARIIASTSAEREDALSSEVTPTQALFQQNIYAPKQLSTSDIYRQTRNQITIAKEELNIR